MLFYNIDGNKSNFDAYISQISTLGVKFSALCLAETNVRNDKTASLFRIDGYNGFYNNKIDNKAKFLFSLSDNVKKSMLVQFIVLLAGMKKNFLKISHHC